MNQFWFFITVFNKVRVSKNERLQHRIRGFLLRDDIYYSAGNWKVSFFRRRTCGLTIFWLFATFSLPCMLHACRTNNNITPLLSTPQNMFQGVKLEKNYFIEFGIFWKTKVDRSNIATKVPNCEKDNTMLYGPILSHISLTPWYDLPCWKAWSTISILNSSLPAFRPKVLGAYGGKINSWTRNCSSLRDKSLNDFQTRRS